MPRDKSATEAMNRAIERARRMLFPARLEKWLALGLLTFLASLSDGGGYGIRWPGGDSWPWSKGGTPQEMLNNALDWLRAHASLAIALVSGTFAVGLGIALLLTWLSSRGKLMFLEAVIHDRHAVKEPWERLRAPAWEVFKFRCVLGLLTLVAITLALGAGGLLALDDFRSGAFGVATLAGGLVTLGVSLVTVLPLVLVSAVLDDFVIPVYYLRGGTLGSAWSSVRSEVLAGNVGPIVIFYLLKWLANAGFMILAVLAACLTCCIAALPYVSSVVLLPAHVFFRGYSLYFLEQLGVRVFPAEPPPAAFENYPLRFGG
jgi:hypothetical protein